MAFEDGITQPEPAGDPPQMADGEAVGSALADLFPPGTLVGLKSGGPLMTVSEVRDGFVWTAHWESEDSYLSLGRGGQRLQQRRFHPDMLVTRQPVAKAGA